MIAIWKIFRVAVSPPCRCDIFDATVRHLEIRVTSLHDGVTNRASSHLDDGVTTHRCDGVTSLRDGVTFRVTNRDDVMTPRVAFWPDLREFLVLNFFRDAQCDAVAVGSRPFLLLLCDWVLKSESQL